MSQDQQLTSLIKWLQTFNLTAPHSNCLDISTGVALAEALTQIAPDWFTPSWHAKIKADSLGANWRIKVSNLKKIVEAVTDYYAECLNQQLQAGYVKPDVQRIGEQCDKEELRRLMQLVLGCAVNCEQKQLYITRIMRMEEAVQQVIMQSIQELETSVHGSRQSLGASLNLEPLDTPDSSHQRLLTELQSAVDSRDQLAQRCHELDQQLALLRDERSALQAESKKLQQRLDEFECPGESGAPASLRYSALKKQLEALKDESYKLETSRDDYRVKVELLGKEMSEMQARLLDLQKQADAANRLKDEVDALRETADKVAKYEVTIESYKKKMEDLSDLRRQLKILEDKNTEYLQAKLEHEEEVKRAAVSRGHLEVCKKQLAEAHHKLGEQVDRSDKLEFEAKRLEAQLSAVQREKDRLVAERDALRETNEELKCAQLSRVGDDATGLSGADEAVVNTEMIPPAIKERLVLLQHENKQLREKLQQREEEDKLPVQAILEDSEERLNNLRAANKKANQRILELENKLEELQTNQSLETKAAGSPSPSSRLAADELRRLQLECSRLTASLEERDGSLQAHKQKTQTLQEALARKECELAALEERYKKYIDKAKSVIKSLDFRQQQQQSGGSNAQSPSELVQRNDKRKTADEAERACKEMRTIRDMEDRLMITAFYHYGLARQREAVDQRLAALGSGQGQSFLARQRQPTPRKQYTAFNSK